MTTTVIILNLALSVLIALVLAATALFVLRIRPATPGEEGRAEWRGPFRRPVADRRCQRTAASIATATNSSAR
jgi:hypothetical protein